MGQTEQEALIAAHKAMCDAHGTVKFYLEREMNAPANHQEFAREAREKLEAYQSAVFQLQKFIDTPAPAVPPDVPQDCGWMSNPAPVEASPDVPQRARDLRNIAKAIEVGWDSSNWRRPQIPAELRTIADEIEKSAAPAVSPDVPQQNDEKWRELLWLNHSRYVPNDHMPYGDDGEMQCCGIDFKRWSADEIDKYLRERLWTAKATPVSAPPSAGEQDQRELRCGEWLHEHIAGFMPSVDWAMSKALREFVNNEAAASPDVLARIDERLRAERLDEAKKIREMAFPCMRPMSADPDDCEFDEQQFWDTLDTYIAELSRPPVSHGKPIA